MPEKMETSPIGEYEKPSIKRHAVVMTMAPAGSKMGHGIFPFLPRHSGKISQSKKEYSISEYQKS